MGVGEQRILSFRDQAGITLLVVVQWPDLTIAVLCVPKIKRFDVVGGHP